MLSHEEEVKGAVSITQRKQSCLKLPTGSILHHTRVLPPAQWTRPHLSRKVTLKRRETM